MTDPEARPSAATPGTRMHERAAEVERDRTGGGDGGGDRKGVSAKWLATVAAGLVAIGALAYVATPASAPQPEVTVITDAAQMTAAIHDMHLQPAQERTLLEQAGRQEIEILHFTILQTSRNGQRYDVTTDIAAHGYTLQATTQSFSLPATRSAASFRFAAVAAPPGARMDGTWHTPAATTRYDLTPGQSITVPLK